MENIDIVSPIGGHDLIIKVNYFHFDIGQKLTFSEGILGNVSASKAGRFPFSKNVYK